MSERAAKVVALRGQFAVCSLELLESAPALMVRSRRWLLGNGGQLGPEFFVCFAAVFWQAETDKNAANNAQA